MLTDAEVARIAQEVAASLPDECSIVRVARVSDGAGGFNETATTIAETRCRVSPAGQNEMEIAARRSVSASVSVTLPAATDLRETDRIVCKGRTLEVGYILQYPYDFDVYALCREVR